MPAMWRPEKTMIAATARPTRSGHPGTWRIRRTATNSTGATAMIVTMLDNSQNSGVRRS